MSEHVELILDREIGRYDFGPEHPLKPVRVDLTYGLMRAYGLFEHPRLTQRDARIATREEIERLHSAAYVEAVIAHSRQGIEPYGAYGWGIGSGDVPAFTDMHEASARIAGGALIAAESIFNGEAEHAFHPAGGLHHAMPAAASGFCVYNDPALAIAYLLDHGIERVAYVDVDVHHGDGVQSMFYSDPRVLTISLHESGAYLFPGTGFPQELGLGDAEGTKVNVALPPSTGHDAYLEMFDRVVPGLVEAFKPWALVTQLGCDTHATDPLAHLALETRTYHEIYARLHALAHSAAGGHWLATGGGGYQIFTVVPRAWTMAFAQMLGVEVTGLLPEVWLGDARARGAGRLPAVLVDPPLELPAAQRDNARDGARRATEETLRLLKPYFSV